MTGLAYVPCEMEVNNLERVGKIKESKQFKFKIPSYSHTFKKEIAIKTSKSLKPDGWNSSVNFNLQDSFFMKDNEEWAKCIITRWTDKE